MFVSSVKSIFNSFQGNGYRSFMWLTRFSYASFPVLPYLSLHINSSRYSGRCLSDVPCIHLNFALTLDHAIALYMLSVSPCDGVNKVKGVIHRWKGISCWRNLIVGCPLIWMHNCCRLYMLLYNGQKCSCISSIYQLHVSCCWTDRNVDDAKYPLFCLGRPSSVVL